jgi:hypothetical protein
LGVVVGLTGRLTIVRFVITPILMRGHAAPEVRGSRRARQDGQAGFKGLRALLLLVCLAGAANAASSSDGSASRQLLSATGKPAPHFVLPDLVGSPLRLQDRTGKIVLVHFFATWCEPCRDELAALPA